MKIIFSYILIVLLTHTNNAQDAGKTGMSFLKLSTGTRNAALADAGQGLANHLGSAFYNPALIATLDKSSISVTHNKWIQDASYSVISLNSDIYGIPFGVSINTFGVPGIEIREKPGAALGTFKAQYFAGTLVCGYKYSSELSAGVAFKYLYEGLFSEEATGYAADFGVFYSGLVKGLDLGFSVRNLGKMDKPKNSATELPSEIKAGGSYPVEIPVSGLTSRVTLEGGKYFNSGGIKLNLGSEISFNDLGFFRVGYKTGVEAGGFTAGLGVSWNMITFEYAFIPLSDELGNGNMIGLSYQF